MCGIVGLANWSDEPVDPELLWRMIGEIRHRGPDADGVFVDESVGLAHARLSIIDIAGGLQPMSNEDRTLCITFNGEIFNYLELRRDLEARGHRFVTKSDTEVILHAYEEKGERCVEDFNGQWAFAIWDAPKRRLFLSRDRIGVRPLFYTSVGQSFLFGSEIKSLFRHPAVARRLDPRSLDQTFTFWAPLTPHTSFSGILELPPGHSMSITESSLRVERYWAPEYQPDLEDVHDERHYADQLRELLGDATRIRLRSDVPVGAYLSGGLDSTVITSLIKRSAGTALRTFSVTFDEAEFDESGYQQEAVRFLHTDHRDFRCSSVDIGRVFPEVVWHAETPILRTAPAPMFLLSALVRREGYKVVLTGEGADEMFGGYDVFKEAKIRRFCATRPDSRIRPLLLKRLYPYLPQMQSQSPEYLRAFFDVRADDCANPFFSHLPRWNLTAKLKLFLSPELKAHLADYDGYADVRSMLPDNYSNWHHFSQAQYLETSGILPGYILSSQGDRMAMAHAVEGRYPFLDHRVVDFAMRLPPRLKMKVLQEKYLLKRSFDGLIPAGTIRRKKQPYRAPDAKSFFGSSENPVCHEYVDDLLCERRIREDGIFSPDAVQRLTKKARAGQVVSAVDNMALVGILSTQLLTKQFIRDWR